MLDEGCLSSLARIDLGGSIVERYIGKSERIPASLGRHVGGVSTGLNSAACWRGSNAWLGLVWRYTNPHSRRIFHQIFGGGDHYLSLVCLDLVVVVSCCFLDDYQYMEYCFLFPLQIGLVVKI